MISVVIPALNAASTLGDQLDALAAQTYGGEWEVVVADNGSSDGTVAVAESFRDRLDVRVADASARRGPSAARNVGVEASRGDLLLFCDADDVVLRQWVDAMAGVAEPNRCATGPYRVVDRVPVRSDETAAWRSSRREPPLYMGQVPMVQSGNFAVARRDFERVGGFDEDLRYAEDADLGVRLFAAGCDVRWCSEAQILTRNRATTGEQFRQFFSYGLWDVVVYRKHRGRSLRPPRIRDALRDYLSLLVHLHRLARRHQRRSWIVTAGQRAGRLVGSVRGGTLCL